MTQEKEPIRFTEVTIDDSGQPAGYHLSEIPAEPLTDQRLASLSFRQRVDILRDMQNGYTYLELTRTFRFELTYVSPITLNLAKTIVDVQNREWEVNHATNQRTNLQANYETEKQSIRRGEKGSRGIEKKIQEAATAWKRQDETLGSQERAGRVLKDTVLDMFIHDLFLQPDGPEKFLIAVEDLVSQSSFTKEDTLRLLQQASLRLRSRGIHEDSSFFGYKMGNENFIREIDAKLLQQIVELAFGDVLSSNPNAWQLKQCAVDLLDFYWNNSKSLFGNDEKTPYLAYMNDIFYAAGLTNNLDVVEQVINYIWNKLESGNTLVRIRREYEEAGTLASKTLPPIITEIERDHQTLAPSMPSSSFLFSMDLEYLEKWNPEKRRCRVEKNFDRLGDLNLTSMLASALLGKRKYFLDWYPQEQRKMGLSYIVYYAHHTAIDFIMNNAFPSTLHTPSLIQRFFSRKLDVERAESVIGQRFDVPGNTQERQRLYSKAKTTIEGLSPGLREDFISNAIILALFSNLGIDDIRELRTSSEQNIALFRQIRDKNLWFVAENGDQFSVEKNTDLSGRSIKSLIFYPNPDYSGWQINIETELVDENNQFLNCTVYLNQEGHFVLGSGNRIKAPTWASLPFERFILDRLYFITSGVLGQREAHKGGEREETKVIEVRRSHWRKLTSTSDRIYTLTSEAARRHAEYVLQTYGIDIYQENLRRRAVGTLGSQEYMTFVRAVQKRNMEPNQIIFDPSLLVDVA